MCDRFAWLALGAFNWHRSFGGNPGTLGLGVGNITARDLEEVFAV